MKFRLYMNGKLNAEHPTGGDHETHMRRLYTHSVAQFPKSDWELVIRDSLGNEYHMLSHKPGAAK